MLKFRVGGFDRRREVFKGWVEIEPFAYNGFEGSFCVLRKEAVRLRPRPLVVPAAKILSSFRRCRAIRSRGASCGKR
jgi:hypothetical protein